MICEVGPRDGLQNESRVLDPAVRAELVDRLTSAGLRRVEVVSFVDSRRLPAMGSAEETVALVPRRHDVTYSGLVLNERGYERFRATALDEVHVVFAATETFNHRNQGTSVDDSLKQAERIIELAHGDGRGASATIAVAFGCPFEGRVEPMRVLSFAERLIAAGADSLVLADTIGVAVPRQVRSLVEAVRSLGVSVGLHLHNTRNTAIANALAGLEHGVCMFDSSIGGTGGCPFAPRASGNVATEDLVYAFHGEGIDTGVSLDGLIETSAWLEQLLGHPLESQVYRAGDFVPSRPKAHRACA